MADQSSQAQLNERAQAGRDRKRAERKLRETQNKTRKAAMMREIKAFEEKRRQEYLEKHEQLMRAEHEQSDRVRANLLNLAPEIPNQWVKLTNLTEGSKQYKFTAELAGYLDYNNSEMISFAEFQVFDSFEFMDEMLRVVK